MWGCEGAANAFSKGHYAISLVAKVTDGTLTFGVKNEYGTKGSEWTGVGNFGLWYLGEAEESETPTPNDVLTAAIAEVTEYNADRITTLTERYVPDIDAEVYSDAPGYAAVQKATLLENKGVTTLEAAKTIGETMEAIAETKLAYASLYEVADKVFNKYFDFPSPEGDQVEADYSAVRDSLAKGTYENAAAAAAVEPVLYAKYPDYMEVKAYNDYVDVEPSDEEAFNYLVTTSGRAPSVVIGGNFYDELTEDEVIFAFEYSATTDLPQSRFYIGKDADDTHALSIAIPAATELTQVYINLIEAVKEWGFGKTNDEIRWNFPVGDKEETVVIRHARMITVAQLLAEDGKLLNPVEGDATGDCKVDLSDYQYILNLMATEDYDPAADVTGDGKVDLSDYQYILNIMSTQE
jgi:hypothetical protein